MSKEASQKPVIEITSVAATPPEEQTFKMLPTLDEMEDFYAAEENNKSSPKDKNKNTQPKTSFCFFVLAGC